MYNIAANNASMSNIIFTASLGVYFSSNRYLLNLALNLVVQGQQHLPSESQDIL
jgi:hypothetical protein